MKRLLLLTGILVVLVVVAWASGMFGGPPSTVQVPPLKIDTAAISKVDVKTSTDHVQAVRNDSGAWHLVQPASVKADTGTVMRLVREAGKMQFESIVTSNPEQFQRFQVDSTSNRLTLDWGDKSLKLFVGKMGPDFQSRYVRLDGDNRVMLASGVPPLTAKLDQWRDKILWSMPESAVTNVFITNGKNTYGVVKGDKGWHVTSGSKELNADSAQVAQLVRRLGMMKVDGFEPGLTPDSVLSNVTNKLQVEFANGSSETLVMSKRKNDVAVLRQGSPDVYKFYPYRLTILTPTLEKLTGSAKSS